MKRTFTSLLFLFVFGLTPRLSAQIIASSASGDWSATTTWVGGVVPRATDSVTISGAHIVAVTANASCGALTIGSGASAATLNINSGVTLTVEKAVAINRANADNTVNLLNVGAGTLTAAAFDLKGNVANPTRITRLSISTGTVNAFGSAAAALDGSINATGPSSEIVFTGAGTLNFNKNFMSGANGGTLTAGTGSIVANGAVTTVLGGYTFNNLTLVGAGAVQLVGNTVINGVFDNTSKNLNVRVRGNLTAGGTFNAGTGLYTFESTTPATNPVTARTLAGNISISRIEIDTNLTLTVPAGSTLTNAGSFNNYGTLVNSGTLVKPSGPYRGNGTFSGATYVNAAVVAPGDSLACLTFANGYDNGTGVLDLDISGTTACTLSDRLVVTGTAKVSGGLKVDFGAFTPTLNQTFPIITGATTFTGAFDSINVLPRRISLTYANGIITVSSLTTAVSNVESSKFSVKSTLVQDVLTINSSEEIPTVMHIYGVSGHEFLTTKVQGEQTVNVSALPAGLYFIRTQTGGIARFVKQ
jgi:hypothetical protein